MSNIFSVQNKIIVITGGSGFLGRQFSEHLTGEQARVVIFDKRGAVPVDVTNVEDFQVAVSRTVKEFGRIDVLIHAAAMDAVAGSAEASQQFAPYERFPRELWEQEMAVNLTAAHLVTQAVAPVMMQQKSGSIIFIASDLALIGPQNSIYEPGKFKDIAYITSKAGLLGLMRSWAAYLGPHNVRANAIAPGGMYRNHPEEFVNKNSALNMLGRMARFGEYNGPIVFLASDASSYMTGACLVVDGGRTAW